MPTSTSHRPSYPSDRGAWRSPGTPGRGFGTTASISAFPSTALHARRSSHTQGQGLPKSPPPLPKCSTPLCMGRDGHAESHRRKVGGKHGSRRQYTAGCKACLKMLRPLVSMHSSGPAPRSMQMGGGCGMCAGPTQFTFQNIQHAIGQLARSQPLLAGTGRAPGRRPVLPSPPDDGSSGGGEGFGEGWRVRSPPCKRLRAFNPPCCPDRCLRSGTGGGREPGGAPAAAGTRMPTTVRSGIGLWPWARSQATPYALTCTPAHAHTHMHAITRYAPECPCPSPAEHSRGRWSMTGPGRRVQQGTHPAWHGPGKTW